VKKNQCAQQLGLAARVRRLFIIQPSIQPPDSLFCLIRHLIGQTPENLSFASSQMVRFRNTFQGAIERVQTASELSLPIPMMTPEKVNLSPYRLRVRIIFQDRPNELD